ncbi:hypothetical protein [Pseudoalteromonas rubra]|uniref:Uncharacterized protein n=1 Tax=Pseudoalteromonas rubra TaxID=43658 RepID=A0A0U3IGG8_9GAMM|nr:hypothetical protein [Pseudoalteromonas rubra]ALU46135.1 hypothetical protein AT705_24545 [Pseudoalteromonas rubra]
MQSTNSVPKLELRDAAIKLVSMGVETKSDFQKLCTGRLEGYDGRPGDIPSDPLGYYGIEFFHQLVSIGKKELRENGEVIELGTVDDGTLSYMDLKAQVHALNITSIREWRRAVKEGRISGVYPRAPQNYYTEFEGWEDFLAPRSKRFLSFPEALQVAAQLARQYDLRTSYDWRRLSRDGLRPADMPSAPDQFYNGFRSWKHFYGIESKR